MKTKADHRYNASPTPLFTILVLSCFVFSCALEEDKTVLKREIPEKTVISILSDAYLTDGLLAIPGVREKYPGKDSISIYVDIIENHGYTKEAMDRTMEFYFVRKPKRLIRIYDYILADLTETDTRLTDVSLNASESDNNNWNGLPFYYLPDLSGTENTEFSIRLFTQGTYTIIFTVTVYPFDQTENPSFSGWFCDPDSITTGKKSYLPAIKYIKDGFPHTYTVTGYNNYIKPVILGGNLFDCENNPESGEKYGKVEGILFLYTGNLE